jgi:predicted regulator of Ras-like GTPase activity (Roadblock/LC7/MglB family)
MSAFGEILQNMVESVPGAVGAVFADWEGEPVDQFAHIPPIDIQIVGAQWGVVFNTATERLARSGSGAVDELWVEGAQACVFVRRVSQQYYVVLATRRSVHLATALRELQRTATRLQGEM